MTREDIITAAVEIVADEGYDRLTLSRLAGALGVRKASIYYHFTDKQELVDSIYVHFRDQFLNLGFAVDFSKDARTVFMTAMSHWKTVFQDRQRAAFISLVEQRKNIDDRSWDVANSLRLMIRGQCEAMLEHVMAAGQMRGVSPSLLSLMFSNTVYSALVDGQGDPDAFLVSFLDSFAK